ncbi:hypothetical protein [Kribbella sp. CCNWLY201]|uniref:hypothetical protein n=1 Tax=Kribbella sp. CCNWLY201 TaxID=3128544 RepID=UPI00301B2831
MNPESDMAPPTTRLTRLQRAVKVGPLALWGLTRQLARSSRRVRLGEKAVVAQV